MFDPADVDHGAAIGDPSRCAREVALGVGWERTGLGLYLPPRQRRQYRRPVGIDLFAGAGGFSLGLHQAGFHMVGALDMDYDAAITYTVNLASKGVRFHFDTPEREAGFTKRLEQHLGLRGRTSHREVAESRTTMASGSTASTTSTWPPSTRRPSTRTAASTSGWPTPAT
jgi:hypothetical protein